MSFQVGQPERRPSRRPPPNYFSRRVQLRLFTMIALVMLVLWAMDQARKPESWYWMWGGRPDFAGGPPLTEEEMAGGAREVDTRLPSAPRQPAPPGVFVAEGEPASLLEGDPEALKQQGKTPDNDPLDLARRDGWSRVVGRLRSDQDDWLRKALKAARDEQPLDEDTLQHGPAVIEQLDAGWSQYLQDASQYLANHGEQLSDEQRAAWQAAVQALELEWRQTVKPALEAVGAGEAIGPEARQTLAALQATLDRLALAAVRDNSVFRSAERDAWFRLLEQLDRSRLEDLEQASTGRVGFIQLFDQPAEYRGKLVTVRGTAHLAYRVQAPKNLYGIDHYYVFWVAPAGGPNSPFCVYALERPAGFPPIQDKDRDRAATPLNVEVEFTGYFFKRWAYRAQDGLRIAPLLLAKAPRWTPPAPVLGTPRPASPFAIALYVLGAAAVGVTLAMLAYWQGQWRSSKRRAYETSPERFARRLKALEENDPAEEIHETLRRLSEK